MISMQAVNKAYPGSRTRPSVAALRDIQLEIQRGDFVTLAGPSGSGKSSFLFTIGAIMKPDSGAVVFDSVDMYHLSPGGRGKLRRSEIGFIFQTFNLLPYLTCLDNVLLPAIFNGVNRKEARRKAESLLTDLGLGSRLDHNPTRLSVGERQRAALARALINNPKLLLADEPTGNLDPESTTQVVQLLKKLNADGLTIVLVTHDSDVAQSGSRQLRLVDGRFETH